ncbi:exonuclease domain-containing protein [Caulobacter sp. UNC279MFTsu5.1]|uniref:exonuclease domain-containing protein n=1 Tax=Caulobacter sp. UNC279MFTsu5.1 TaxID=1502775 RepID=UPI00037E55C6|nr:exonuclease domain-containing protein [Caulobacter sp. UNC279MFTsu5.1]
MDRNAKWGLVLTRPRLAWESALALCGRYGGSGPGSGSDGRDVETTGLDWRQDEIIELAMVPFRYGVDGRIYEVGKAFHGFRQPTRPIPPEITALTGIDDAIFLSRNPISFPMSLESRVPPRQPRK